MPDDPSNENISGEGESGESTGESTGGESIDFEQRAGDLELILRHYKPDINLDEAYGRIATRRDGTDFYDPIVEAVEAAETNEEVKEKVEPEVKPRTRHERRRTTERKPATQKKLTDMENDEIESMIGNLSDEDLNKFLSEGDLTGIGR